MISLTFIVIFVFCLAVATACILISHQLISNYSTDFYKQYFYYLVAFYAFAVYSIWGQIMVRALLSSFESGVGVIETVANFLPVLGIPFLFISWIMLINSAYSLTEENTRPIWKYLHIGIFILLFAGSWLVYNFSKTSSQFINMHLKYVELGSLIVMDLIYYLCFFFIVQYYSAKLENSAIKVVRQFSLIFIIAFVIRSAVLPFVFINIWVLAIVILVYFTSNFIPLFYLRIHADQLFKPIKSDHPSDEKMKYMFKRYKITKREREIVIQICQGKTNQQIADTLFISLQTVKDHTHRIYSKIGINSRMQLVQKVNG